MMTHVHHGLTGRSRQLASTVHRISGGGSAISAHAGVQSCATIHEPPWLKQADSTTTPLTFYDSITKSYVPFKPIRGRVVTWYICGPTVYDSAHVGHARNYVAFDIVRRVLADYFGFDILLVMNITDIDDKIILRAHRLHVEGLVKWLRTLPSLPEEMLAAIAEAEASLTTKDVSVVQFLNSHQSLCESAEGSGRTDLVEQMPACDIQTQYQDLARAFEQEFFEDLDSLNVARPSAVTRVSEYIPDIIKYIQGIADNGFCYETEGSVYFDTAAFAASGKRYGKLEPTQLDNEELLADGEGILSQGQGQKKRANDFVLWKASKVGEPAWDSPWGLGRPGWHIECSTMASDLLGDRVDLNSGGVDLKFPHHENQMAQCEAYFNCNEWVNTFLHTGHLSIQGLKMSKSLKNFITIQDAVNTYSMKQLRFLFLLHRFNEPMEYSTNSMQVAVDLEGRFSTFMGNLQVRLREGGAVSAESSTQRWTSADKELYTMLQEKKAAVHAALCNSIDTPTALKQMEQLIRACNTYMGQHSSPSQGYSVLSGVATWMASMLSCFGLVPDRGTATVGQGGGGEGPSEEQAARYVECLSKFRDAVREGSREQVGYSELLRLCDELRDDILPTLGVRLEDRGEGGASWKLDDPAVLLKERQLKQQQAQAAAAAKAAKKEAALAKEAQRVAQLAVPPEDMYQQQYDAVFSRDATYTAFDADGIPTEAAGEELSKSARKKLIKQQAKHRTLQQQHLESSEK